MINLRACWLKSDADKGCKPLLSLRLWTVNKGACKVISLYKTLPKLKKALFYYVFPLFPFVRRQEITKQGDKNSGGNAVKGPLLYILLYYYYYYYYKAAAGAKGWG